MTPQEIFDKVCKHLKKQKMRSAYADGFMCRYRGQCGTACAVGCLIPDSEYDSRMEGMDAFTLRDMFPHLSLFRTGAGDNLPLFKDLQYVHDVEEPVYWSRELRKLADKYGLKQPHCIRVRSGKRKSRIS